MSSGPPRSPAPIWHTLLDAATRDSGRQWSYVVRLLVTVCLVSGTWTAATSPTAGQTLSAALQDAAKTDLASAGETLSVTFAGGAIEIEVPADWSIAEVPDGRTVRLMAGPTPLPRRPERLRHGIWLTFQHRLPGLSEDRVLDRDLVEERMRLAQGFSVQMLDLQQTQISGCDVLQADFRAPAASPEPALAGVHVIGRTAFGWLELHAVYPQRQGGVPGRVIEQVLASLVLKAPTAPAPGGDKQAERAPLGTWKAYRSVLRILPEGAIRLTFDRRGTYVTTANGGLHYDAQRTQLDGRYQLRGDLLEVTWEDGSRQNFRWRISRRGDLLLTDHHGRIAQLVWLYE